MSCRNVLLTLCVLILWRLAPAQPREQDPLFELYEGNVQKYIRLSDRVQAAWNLPKATLVHTHYNANIDPFLPADKQIKKVVWVYSTNIEDGAQALELHDDGRHFDNEPVDGIYGNYLACQLSEMNTHGMIIDITFKDTTGITGMTLGSLFPPVVSLPTAPTILTPAHQSVVATQTPELHWTIDPNAVGCEALLLVHPPELGEELPRVVWRKMYRSNPGGVFSEQIPMLLEDKAAYTMLVWSYTNLKQSDGDWLYERGGYSLEWNQFLVESIPPGEQVYFAANYPNPFQEATVLEYSLPDAGPVTMVIYDLRGRRVATLVHGEQSAGEHSVVWDGTTPTGEPVAPGVYVGTLRFCGISVSRKMIHF